MLTNDKLFAIDQCEGSMWVNTSHEVKLDAAPERASDAVASGDATWCFDEFRTTSFRDPNNKTPHPCDDPCIDRHGYKCQADSTNRVCSRVYARVVVWTWVHRAAEICSARFGIES